MTEPTNVAMVPCDFCGMPCAANEYHPYAACLMFKACHNSDTVRANLEAVRGTPAPVGVEPIGYLYCGGSYGDELEDWEFVADQHQCDKLNEHHGALGKEAKLPIYITPQPTQAQAGAGTWAHLKLMMEESAWGGTLQLSDALANIDDFAAAHPSPPEGMVGGWISVDERLPGEQGQDSEQVLVFINGHCELTDMECRRGGAWGLRLGYFDAERQAFRVHGRPEYHVTHWRPEPAPPASEANGA